MTHTLESLMELALQSALTEVLAELQREQADNVAMSMLADEYKAERDALARNKLIDQDAFVALRAERDTLQSKVTEQAAEIERLKAVIYKERRRSSEHE